MANVNLEALAQGKAIHIGITAANLARSVPEFATTKAEARKRRRELEAVGYRVHLFEITPAGGLSAPFR
jgi:hypothetical protein